MLIKVKNSNKTIISNVKQILYKGLLWDFGPFQRFSYHYERCCKIFYLLLNKGFCGHSYQMGETAVQHVIIKYCLLRLTVWNRGFLFWNSIVFTPLFWLGEVGTRAKETRNCVSIMNSTLKLSRISSFWATITFVVFCQSTMWTNVKREKKNDCCITFSESWTECVNE